MTWGGYYVKCGIKYLSGSHIKMNSQLPVVNSGCCDMTEKLLKCTSKPLKCLHMTHRKLVFQKEQSNEGLQCHS